MVNAIKVHLKSNLRKEKEFKRYVKKTCTHALSFFLILKL